MNIVAVYRQHEQINKSQQDSYTWIADVVGYVDGRNHQRSIEADLCSFAPLSVVQAGLARVCLHVETLHHDGHDLQT